MVNPAEQADTRNPAADRMPKLVCFDLDYTLWDLWIDTHITPPIKRKGDAVNTLYDRHGTELAFYREVPDVLAELKKSSIHIAAASRTHAPDLAREALGLLLVPLEKGSSKIAKAITFFQTMEIYPGMLPNISIFSSVTHLPLLSRV
ncbi:hypothetical protein QFC19_002622 [Naganishia cerealis]|uniref:Uncharacterized protein n=1 Tax=Naganishia cerealis TaxID=610337 RepID=A0ACC2W9J6_9TREE|nr:hypothetical protein QFC19_002622 [Naganishia cerealis]